MLTTLFHSHCQINNLPSGIIPILSASIRVSFAHFHIHTYIIAISAAISPDLAPSHLASSRLTTIPLVALPLFSISTSPQSLQSAIPARSSSLFSESIIASRCANFGELFNRIPDRAATVELVKPHKGALHSDDTQHQRRVQR